MNKFLPSLIALVLIGGCSSGGGTESSGDGLGVQTTESHLLLTASLQVEDSGGVIGFSVDAIQDLCEIPEEGEPITRDMFESGLTTAFGTMTISVRDLVDSSGLTPVEFFPEGVTFDRYRVSYTSPNSHAPHLEDRVFFETFTLPNGTSNGSFTVILLDLDLILAQFQGQTSGSPASYQVKVTAMGKEFNGSPISVSAQTFIEVGNFDRC